MAGPGDLPWCTQLPDSVWDCHSAECDTEVGRRPCSMLQANPNRKKAYTMIPDDALAGVPYLEGSGTCDLLQSRS